MFHQILAAFDGSTGSERAFDQALDLAQKYRGEMVLVSVVENLPRYAEQSMDCMDEMLEEGKKHFEGLQEELIERAKCSGINVGSGILPSQVIEIVVTVAEHENAESGRPRWGKSNGSLAARRRPCRRADCPSRILRRVDYAMNLE